MTRTLEMVCHVAGIGRGTGRSATASAAYQTGGGGRPPHEPRSATAAAAYRAGAVITCEREGRTHDYTRKQGVEATAIVLPGGAPDWAKNRAKLWNAAELREMNKDKRAKSEFKKNAKVAREFMFGFAAELSAAGRAKVADAMARHLADTHGLAVDYAIHEPGREGDQRNNHCHMMTTTRRMTPKGLGEKAREWDDWKTGSRLVTDFRARLAATMNAQLKAEGKAEAVFVEHRSFKDRGIDQTPTRHQGPGKTHAYRKRERAARAAWEKQTRKDQQDRHTKERAALKARQDFNMNAKLADIAAREKAGIKAIRDNLAARQAADTSPTGASRIFQKITGQAMRADFEREARQAERAKDADRQIAELKAALQKERSDYVAGQKRDADALRATHTREDQQHKQAVSARFEYDRTVEREARRAEVRSHSRERDHGRSRGRDAEPGFSP